MSEAGSAKYAPIMWLIGVFCIALGPNLRQGEAPWWEAANALGFVAFAGLLILLANGYRKSGYSHFHRWVGIAVAVTMMLHALWFLISDASVMRYFMPGAPIYMVLGLSAFCFALLLTISSLKGARNNAYSNAKTFRFWHNWQSVVIVILSAFHIVLSGYYFTTYWQALLLGILVVSSFLMPMRLAKSKKVGLQDSLSQGLWLLIASLCVCAVFLITRWIA